MTLGQGAGEEHGRLAVVALEIGAEVHASPTPDAEIPLQDIFNQLVRSTDLHYRQPSRVFL